MEEGTVTQKAILLAAIQSGDGSAFLKITEDLHYADIADVIDHLDSAEMRIFSIQTLDNETLSDVIPELPERLVEESFAALTTSQQRALLEETPDDDRVDILQDVSPETREKLLLLLPRRDQDLTRNLLRYGEETAGGRMTTQIGILTADQTVRQAIDSLKTIQEETETLARIYVVDAEERPIGKLRLRDLTFNTVDTPIRDLMVPVEHTILATADQEDAANMLRKYDLVVLPVTDEFGHLRGVITYDDAMEILSEESTEDIEKMSGISGDQSEDSYLKTALSTHFKRRFGWLSVLGILAIASGYVMMRYEEVLTSVFLLSLFLPMVVASGGNTGGQAATMVIRAMSLGELEPGNALKVGLKELKLGALMGGALGLLIGIVCVTLLPLLATLPAGMTFPLFGIAVGTAIALQIATSTLTGALLPLGARAIKLDPAVVASPAITTLVDISGMVIYFTVAKALLGL